MPLADYVKILAATLDIPINYNKKLNGHPSGLIEALHVIFSLYATFRQSQHFSSSPVAA
jgi:hypothetical protein